MEDPRLVLLEEQNMELKGIIGILIEKLGGEVRITREEIVAARMVAKEREGITNVYRLTSSRA
jgi:hypothetical protein